MKVLFFQHAGSDVYQEHNRLARTTTCDFFRFTSRFIGYVHASRHRHIGLELWNTSACHYVSRNNDCNSTTLINNKTHYCLYFPIDFLFNCFVFPFSLHKVIQVQVKYLSYYFNTFSLNWSPMRITPAKPENCIWGQPATLFQTEPEIV